MAIKDTDTVIICTRFNYENVKKWCRQNIGKTGWDCMIDPNTFDTFTYFSNKDDAMRFKLTFGGE